MTKAKEYEYITLGQRPLIRQDYLYVMINHEQLNELIASLMHVAELDSDREHREALKGELKRRARDWLDDQFKDAGYINHEVIPQATVIDVPVKESTAA